MALLRKSVRKLRRLYSDADEKIRWKKWLRAESVRKAKDRLQAPAAIDTFARKPLISVIVPVYNIDEIFLRRCLQSVLDQWYPRWELCVADDFSPAPHVRKVLEEFAQADVRIKPLFRDANDGISEASNSALALATGEFCALLDHDDELSEDALFRVAAEINRSPDVDLLYSDEDKIDESGNRFDPTFKPDWSCDLFYSLNMLNHLTVYRTHVVRAAREFRKGFEGSQDYDLALRVLELVSEENIRHIPNVLYHWRALPGSVALAGSEKSYAHDRARTALAEHFQRTGVAAKVTAGANNWHRVRYGEGSRDIDACVFIYGHDAATVSESAERLRSLTNALGAKYVEIVHPPNRLSAELNDAVSRSTADVLCFVSSGLTPLSDDWLDELCGFALHEPIGAVGGKVLDANETVVGTGLIVGAGEAAETAHYGLPRGHGGNLGRNLVSGNYSAVSIMCMATRREHFEVLGGFDSDHFPSALFDVDYCLKLRNLKYRIAFTPYAELIGPDRRLVPDPSQSELEYFRSKYGVQMGNDPFYNPNLSTADGRFRIRA